MKTKIAALLLALLMICACIPGVGAESTGKYDYDVTAYFDFFLSRKGDILFSMSDAPDCTVHEADFVHTTEQDRDWLMGITDNTQLCYSDENGEWQYHIADISLMIEELRAAHPDDSEATLQFNALGNFAMLYATVMTNGTPAGEVRPFRIDEGGKTYVGVELDFTYADTPGVSYRCTGLTDGKYAVMLKGNVDERYEAMAATIRPVNPEKEQTLNGRLTPTTVQLGELSMTFPCAPDRYEDPAIGQIYLDGFTSDFSYVNAEHIEMDMGFMLDPDDPNAVLELTEYVAQQYKDEGAIDEYETVLFAPGIGLMKCKMLMQPQGFAEDIIIWSFISEEHGAYVIQTSDSPEGQAFLESITLAE